MQKFFWKKRSPFRETWVIPGHLHGHLFFWAVQLVCRITMCSLGIIMYKGCNWRKETLHLTHFYGSPGVWRDWPNWFPCVISPRRCTTLRCSRCHT